MELKLPSTAGWRPPKKKMMFLPKVSSCLRLPLRKPSPTPTSRRRDPTPHAIPNMVRNDRSLCAQSVRIVWTKVSSSVRMTIPHKESVCWTAGSGKRYRDIEAEKWQIGAQLLIVNVKPGGRLDYDKFIPIFSSSPNLGSPSCEKEREERGDEAGRDKVNIQSLHQTAPGLSAGVLVCRRA